MLSLWYELTGKFILISLRSCYFYTTFFPIWKFCRIRASQPLWQQFINSSVPTASCWCLPNSDSIYRKWKWREQIQVWPQWGPREGPLGSPAKRGTNYVHFNAFFKTCSEGMCHCDTCGFSRILGHEDPLKESKWIMGVLQLLCV